MTIVEFRVLDMIVPVASPKPWDEVLDIVGRAFWPDGPRLGGPEIPKEPKR